MISQGLRLRSIIEIIVSSSLSGGWEERAVGSSGGGRVGSLASSGSYWREERGLLINTPKLGPGERMRGEKDRGEISGNVIFLPTVIRDGNVKGEESDTLNREWVQKADLWPERQECLQQVKGLGMDILSFLEKTCRLNKWYWKILVQKQFTWLWIKL